VTLYAAIDVGSNSLRSLVVRSSPPFMEYIFSSSEITRITQGLREGRGVLEEEAIARTCASLEKLCARFHEKKIPRENTVFFATESLRTALNAEEVVKRLEGKAFLPLRILSGEEEAWYTLYGSSLAFPDAEGVFDLGGGSLEISSPSKRESLPLGAVRMFNLFGENLQELRAYLRKNLKNLSVKPGTLLGVGGTSSALAMMCRSLDVQSYSPEKVHGLCLETQALEETIERLGPLSLEERKKIPGLPEKRADIIVSGLVVIQELLRFFRISSYIHSECDLLWGTLREKALQEGVILDKASFS